MSLIVVDIELTQKKHKKELGPFLDGNVERFSLFPPKIFKLIKQTTWCTNHLHEIAWSSRFFEYDKLFDIFHDINTMNAEVFVKSLEKCKLVSRLLGENVENLDDYGCPKIQDLTVERRKVSWIFSS